MKVLSDVAEKRQGVENMIAQVENKNKETEGKIAEVEGKIKEATEKLKSAEQQVKEMDMKAKEADKKGHADFDAGQKVLKDTETAGLALQKELNDMKKQADDVMKKEVTLDQVAADASKRIADLAPAVKNFEDAAMKALSDVAEKRQGVENMIAQVENKNKETEGKIAEVEGKIKEATEKLKSAEQQVKEMDMKAKEADKKGHADFDAGQKV